ncbi:Hpt domain-containing protein [Algoriphagus limi]|uniref:Hpt domain-containing protein n=1 Tax=Algoriphagus limi TaxID=2975273 RepID=A0ABT2G4B4_9BACT|nr:Hpt domain-containing protein [Algoriphagus limi]MCS5489608.1 Hpt domain-containing protein [Algoriphagus limi]
MYQYISESSIYQYFGEDDPDMIREMIQIILDTNIHDLEELPHFYHEKDFLTIKKRCHKAKPSMSYIGAVKTRKLLEEIEENLEASQDINEMLQSHLAGIKRELGDFLETVRK